MTLDEEGFPSEEGVYLVNSQFENEDNFEIDVYEDEIGHLCCFAEDYGTTTNMGDHRYHVPVQNAGLMFIKRIRDLK